VNTTIADRPTLAARIDAALPQTQCTRCGYPDCRAYADAIAAGQALINRCPPGGAEGVRRLAAITGQPIQALDAERGHEGPRRLAVIDESWCIGCTLCIKACPVDCIVGAPKLMHTVIDALCTGCELCVPVCPVDCISMPEVTPGRSGWQAWGQEQAEESRQRYGWHRVRVQRDKHENDERLAAKAQAKLADLASHSQITDSQALAAKRAVVEAALQRARAGRASPAVAPAAPMPTEPPTEPPARPGRDEA
jgi:Na+-translocating ferredoxin:NAD+ oxidoreductase subunit B